MMHTSAKAALGTYTNLAAKCKVLPKDSEYIEIMHNGFINIGGGFYNEKDKADKRSKTEYFRRFIKKKSK
ncbi:MAG: hypothetical protein K2N51_09075 [Lachnospiraceae bacterium]|nr:hypothetical protein [Lachnospiraceae bacterium]